MGRLAALGHYNRLHKSKYSLTISLHRWPVKTIKRVNLMQFAHATDRHSVRQQAASRYCGVALVALATVLSSTPAFADPAANAASFSQSTAGSISASVPDGICSAITATRGGAGASSGVGTTNSGRGGGGAVINARFSVLPGQVVSGTVASGGQVSTVLAAPNNGTGTANGGSAGASFTGFLVHRGGGGGGSSSLSIAGIKVVEAGGGGGAGASHSTVLTTANGGGGGFTGIAAGVAAPGLAGANGVDGSTAVNGGNGGGAAAGGAGGTGAGTLSGLAGSGIGTGTGGNGGPNDQNTDTGGGGGGGYTGGGGGASTTNSSVTAAGGGGGSSFVRATSPTLAAPAPTTVSGSAGPQPAAGANAGSAGLVTIDWVPCVYTLAVTKTASVSTVNAGGTVRWTITVRNSGPDPMTKGDLLTLNDTLPAGGGSTFRVVSVSTTAGSSDLNLASGTVTCSGVTVGAAMPASTDCSRAYNAPSAPGAPSGGLRGLNSGETITIVYDQVFNNAIPAATVNNTASTVDRSSTSGTTDIIGVTANRSASASVGVVPYDLRVIKTTSSASLPAGGVITWTVVVTNLGPGAMYGPDATVANPLVVTDIAPTANVSAPVSFTSSGSAGSCTYTTGTITCPTSLPLNGTQTFTFQQTIVAGTPMNAVITNSASAVDYTTGDSNDSGSATVTVQGSSDLRVTKTNGASSAFSGSTVTYTVTVTNVGPDPVTGALVTDVVGAGLTCPAGNAVTITGSGVPGGSFTISNLTGAGIALGALNSGQSAVLTYSCQVN